MKFECPVGLILVDGKDEPSMDDGESLQRSGQFDLNKYYETEKR